jgi:hypothetical protein
MRPKLAAANRHRTVWERVEPKTKTRCKIQIARHCGTVAQVWDRWQHHHLSPCHLLLPCAGCSTCHPCSGLPTPACFGLMPLTLTSPARGSTRLRPTTVLSLSFLPVPKIKVRTEEPCLNDWTITRRQPSQIPGGWAGAVSCCCDMLHPRSLASVQSFDHWWEKKSLSP